MRRIVIFSVLLSVPLVWLAFKATTNVKPFVKVYRDGFPPKLNVGIYNVSFRPIRIWSLNNSWGYPTLRIHLRNIRTGETFVIKRKDAIFTPNGPWYATISPLSSRRFLIDLEDGWWILPTNAVVSSREYAVQVELSIPPSVEAAKHRVFVGKALTSWK